ncbi:hypothetical protein SAY87_004200 [Trapa incisa]|uniref:RING-type domain-containing protein n=1 Tax=Trapa incisa TaxID=236973 RepID=A0AAN7JPL4_9MYRT|nr:hypothetical protein SAY87_004200 [Trapa incisa]
MGLDFGVQQRYARFCGRIVVLSVLCLLYPFLWTWTIIGTLWYRHSGSCFPGGGQKCGFVIWLVLSYCGLICIACMAMTKVFHLFSIHLCFIILILGHLFQFSMQVLVDMIWVPEWAFEAAGQEMRVMGQDAAIYHPGFYLTPTQREAVEALIQELPKFRLKAVPTDCSECPICLEEFRVGNEIRGLPCAHNFHMECIDEWLRLNVKCPRCRCSVFPNLDLSALSNLHPESDRSLATVVATTTSYVAAQPSSQSYRLSLQGLLCHIHTENAQGNTLLDSPLESAENRSVNPGGARSQQHHISGNKRNQDGFTSRH